jgi:beta-lactamase class A
MTRLLALLWTDQAGPAAACGRVRDLMARQLTRNKIASGFGRDVNVAAKSGGLMGVVRNEIGVVSFRDEPAYAVAVFTRADAPSTDERLVNRAIGAAAAEAVGQLRPAARP